MRIKVGEKLPSSELFYLDQNYNVKKVDILDLCKDNKTIILIMGLGGSINSWPKEFINSLTDNFNIIRPEIYQISKYKNMDVMDPYYGTIEDFEKAYSLIEIGAKSIVKNFRY